LYFLGCNPAPPNNNTSQNQGVSPNANHANTNSSKNDMKPCEATSEPGSHAQHIKDEIKDKMGPSLKKLLKTNDNPNGTFTVEISKAENGTYFVGRIKGKISGDDNLKELSNILNDFQSRQECLRVIYFQPDPALALPPGGGGFEWSSCEYPMVVCPNGECCMPIDVPNPSPGVNTNANVNSNGNSNGNANRGNTGK
ncbi:MAG TPA: hypothetical protein VJV05_16230, partial [Pyrinomonadaceae bacterium]|nr:hypothetical protein [Pyrinomonadaceae bacterium]